MFPSKKRQYNNNCSHKRDISNHLRKSINVDQRIMYFRSFQTWNVLLKILIFDVVSLTAYSPSDDQTNSNAEPKDLFLHARAVYIMYSPSPQTTTNLPLGLCFKFWNQTQNKICCHYNENNASNMHSLLRILSAVVMSKSKFPKRLGLLIKLLKI